MKHERDIPRWKKREKATVYLIRDQFSSLRYVTDHVGSKCHVKKSVIRPSIALYLLVELVHEVYRPYIRKYHHT